MEDEEDALNRLAREEILKETRRAASRANDVGSSGWLKCSLLSVNKRFIHNTLLSTLTHPKKSKVKKDSSKTAPDLKSNQSDKNREEKVHKEDEKPIYIVKESKTKRKIDEASSNQTETKTKKKRKHDDCRSKGGIK